MTAFLRDDAATGKFRFLLSGALAIRDKSLCSALGQMKDTKVSKVSSMNISTFLAGHCAVPAAERTVRPLDTKRRKCQEGYVHIMHDP